MVSRRRPRRGGRQTRYLTEGREAVESEFHNVFLLEFDADGRCKEFTELYVPRSD